ncbi:hypothetical protein ABES25_02600 [Bacillus gobiensis]|uniref:hypothetical protein n=1 Tax=Bacillus gobiensis TaxID=1441095 RepID=UPI003D205649
MKSSDPFFYFATIISKDYLIKGLSFYDSLKNKTQNSHVWICCMDDVSYDTLSKMELEQATLIHLADIENEELRQVKSGRKLNEYCWTIKAPLCIHVLKHYKEIDHIIYCDADMYFFLDPEPIHTEWGSHPAFLCRQRGSHELERLHGSYQAGLIGFKRNEQGMTILHWWNDRCIEKCFDVYEETSWGDQKYLDRIPHLFPSVKILEHIGINAAPWNLVMNNSHKVWKKDGRVYLDDSELVAYHFGSMLILNELEFELWKLEILPFSEEVRSLIYMPYIKSLRESGNKLMKKINVDESLLYAAPPSDYSVKNSLKL